MKKIIVATKNKGKLKEIKQLLSDMDFEILSMNEAGIDIEIEETGNTFEENAMIKAKALQNLSGAIVIADDSGLEVDFLDGAPGIYSARYSGEYATDDKNNEKLLEALKDVPDEKRTGRFVCTIAVVLENSESFFVRETIEGVIGHDLKGENGFGYDPLFYLPQYNRTMAEISAEEKNRISHRGKALNKMADKLKKIYK